MITQQRMKSSQVVIDSPLQSWNAFNLPILSDSRKLNPGLSNQMMPDKPDHPHHNRSASIRYIKSSSIRIANNTWSSIVGDTFCCSKQIRQLRCSPCNTPGYSRRKGVQSTTVEWLIIHIILFITTLREELNQPEIHYATQSGRIMQENLI